MPNTAFITTRHAVSAGAPVLLSALLLTTSAALAAPPVGYEVFISAQSRDSWTSQYAFAGYNASANLAPNDNNIARYNDRQAYGVCTSLAECIGASYGTSANGIDGAATAARSSAVLTTAVRGPGAEITSHADAWADLSLAKVGVSAFGLRRASPNSVVEGVTADAKARIADTLRFTIAGANAGTVTRIGMVWDIDGSFDNRGPFAPSVKFWFGIGDALAYGSVTQGSDVLRGTAGTWAAGSGFTRLSEDHVQFTGYLDLVGPSADLGAAIELWAFDNLSGHADWGNTGSMRLVLPSNVSYTSASGVFLAAPIPEPGTWALMGLGLLAMAAQARRQRRG
jgi:hypothetical protein